MGAKRIKGGLGVGGRRVGDVAALGVEDDRDVVGDVGDHIQQGQLSLRAEYLEECAVGFKCQREFGGGFNQTQAFVANAINRFGTRVQPDAQQRAYRVGASLQPD